MKHLLLIFVAQICMLRMQAQHFAISNDKMNVVYIGVDNPITIAVENWPCNKLVVKVNNGTITGSNCKFIYRGTEPGATNIVVFKKTAKVLKVIGYYSFRVKRLPAPVFKIGHYASNYSNGNEKTVQKIVLAAQQFVRADLENFDIDVKYWIDSFSVKIFYSDSAKVKTFFNITGKISQELSEGFSVLKKDDIVVFHKIFAKGPDGLQYELNPLILTINK